MLKLLKGHERPPLILKKIIKLNYYLLWRYLGEKILLVISYHKKSIIKGWF